MLRKKFLIPALSVIALFLAVMVVLSVSPKLSDYAADFSWVKGRLEFNPIEGGFWQIRFGDESAPYGGKFVLGNDPKLAGFKTGDLVKITGKISPEQVSIFMAGWIYKAEKIERLR